ncbi:hypothetical protein GCM10023187_02220 [Nibrella viscosa]|uniref:Uncharacterized protein n=1 Tax=Nibrella viscosa TaxID=1084524 RepID=A0ABP8JSE6_9BACT
MSFQATLTVEGKTFDVLQCKHIMSQKYERGRPTSAVRGGVIILILDGTDEDLLGDWASGATVKKDGDITFNRIDQNSTLQKLEFQEAYATHYFEFMSSQYIDSEAVLAAIEGTINMDLKTVDDNAERLIRNTKTLVRFVERTRISNCILLRLSAGQIKLDGIEHRNS